MLNTSPRLYVRRPSPTTAEFTVSTRPPPSIGIYFANAALLLLRILAASAAILLAYAEWAYDPERDASRDAFDPSNSTTAAGYALCVSWAAIRTVLDAALAMETVGPAILHLAKIVPPVVALPCAVLTLYATLLRVHSEESLLVLRGLGVQTSSLGRTVFSSRSTRFIPTDKIRQVLINEAMWGFRARHCLVIIVDGEEEMVVVFPRLLPPMEVVLTVWHGIRGCLREKQGLGKGR